MEFEEIEIKNPPSKKKMGFISNCLKDLNYFFFTAFLFGKSVILPWKISAHIPTDSCKVGCA